MIGALDGIGIKREMWKIQPVLQTLLQGVPALLWLGLPFLATEAREKRFYGGDARGNDSYCFSRSQFYLTRLNQ